jgi:hypothetical protein
MILACRTGPALAELATKLVDRDDGVGALVGIDAKTTMVLSPFDRG